MLNQQNFPIQKYWLIKPLINQSVLSFFLFFIMDTNQANAIPPKWMALLIILFSLYLLTYPFITVFTLKFELREDAIWAQQGFFTRKQGNFYYHKIQDVTITQGFVDRLLNLYTMSVENAGISRRRSWIYTGFNNNSFTVPGLKKPQAEALRQEILNRMQAQKSNRSEV